MNLCRNQIQDLDLDQDKLKEKKQQIQTIISATISKKVIKTI